MVKSGQAQFTWIPFVSKTGVGMKSFVAVKGLPTGAPLILPSD
jgi:hypothetical protein